jgi:exosortase/archaeosortase family protein
MVVASVPIAIVMNGLRITATAVASEAWGPETATGSWHTFSGWLTFLGSVMLLIALQRVMGVPSAATPLPTQTVNA